MKKFLILFFIFLMLFSINCYALSDGLYQGEFVMCVDNPTQCAPNNPGYVRIINLGYSNVIYQNILIWMGQEIVLGEVQCSIRGNAILCDCDTQILDMSTYGFDAIITNNTDHGAGVLTDNGFTMNYSVRRNTCEGSDCDIVGEWMYGPEASFPCNIGPWISNFELIN